MYLTHLEGRDFRSFAELELELEPPSRDRELSNVNLLPWASTTASTI